MSASGDGISPKSRNPDNPPESDDWGGDGSSHTHEDWGSTTVEPPQAPYLLRAWS